MRAGAMPVCACSFCCRTSPLARLNHLAQIRCGAYLEGPATHAGMPRHQLDGVVSAVGLEYQYAAQLFLGFGVRTVGDGDLAVLKAQRHGALGGLQGLSAGEVAVLAQHVVVGEAVVDEGIAFAFGLCFSARRVHVAETDVFHRSSCFDNDCSSSDCTL